MRNFFHHAQDPASCWTHAAGAVAALGGGLWMLLRGLWQQTTGVALGASLCFCLSMVALYAASAIYHYYPGDTTSGGVKKLLRKMDHGMIYVLIAGSYTPFCLVLLPQPRGRRFCMVMWAVAVAGILAKLLWINAPRMLSTAVYLIMGWAVVFLAKDFACLGQPCLTLVALGGVCYSVGAVFYAIKRPNLSAEWTFHELFHLLILAGSLFHYLAVYFYVV
ncbi:PAQR family membrane homeostasis protein TrhA [Dysosmobacter sp.]|uniref:PAQR family membrane homeostasis protein TrhA n=1 Tax=Dysosmobacter sp. TaxID=2591382 RepID=UPI003A8ECD84